VPQHGRDAYGGDLSASSRDASRDVTRLPAEDPSASARRPSSDSINHGRWPPGTMLTPRYRVVGLLGAGGMGEVYRADDLKLGQTVALKFLPERLARDAGRLAQFHAEVRLARLIAHANVCRVYDIDEAEAMPFLTMEYVDGEDLASLLRRIGRLSGDKALEIARQLCAGVAAAHGRGVVHRDLKPANIMVDGRGQVRVMDFGLADTDGSRALERAGTPAYMAPEQLRGEPATARSDIYALGLVLFELFTGRRPFMAATVAQLSDLQQTPELVRPSAIVEGLDPAIDRAILRCLQHDPLRRPDSALAVAAALPGGDPLAAALAAGETPSPALVAASARTEAISLSAAAAALAVVAIVLAVLPFVADNRLLLRAIPAPKAIDVLRDRADTIRLQLGYASSPVDEYQDIEADAAYLDFIANTDGSPGRWQRLRAGRPAALLYWHRTSPRPLFASSSYPPTLNNPPMVVSGMTTVVTDTQGRLMRFDAVVPQTEADASSAAEPDWSALFRAAELPMASFAPATPRWTPRTFADSRAAWEGSFPEDPSIGVRIEAAAYRGRPVFFQIVGPWSRAERQEVIAPTVHPTVSAALTLAVCAILIGAAIAARGHLRRGRADRRAADSIWALLFGLAMASWLLGAHHVPFVETEIGSAVFAIAFALLNAGFIWLLYLALEPAVRRWQPHSLIGWTRLLNGSIRDPHVGRDVLVGVMAGTLYTLILSGRGVIPVLFGQLPDAPPVTSFAPLLGVRHTLSMVLGLVQPGFNNAMLLILALATLRYVFRRTWIAAAVLAAIAIVIIAAQVITSSAGWSAFVLAIPTFVLLVGTAIRFGLLSTVVMFTVGLILTRLPLTVDPSMAYFAHSSWILGGIMSLAVWAASAARAGQPLFTLREVASATTTPRP
jgi:serine/threonine-protein kinase